MIDILGILTSRLEKIESSIKYLADPIDDDIFEAVRQQNIFETIGRIDELINIAEITLDLDEEINFCDKARKVKTKFRKLF